MFWETLIFGLFLSLCLRGIKFDELDGPGTIITAFLFRVAVCYGGAHILLKYFGG